MQHDPQQYTKPVLVQKQSNINAYIVHLTGICDMYNSDICLIQYRSVRKLIKQPNVKQCRDREPSRIPLNKIIVAMRKKKNRRLMKHVLKRSTPASSILNKLATNFKECCLKSAHMQYFFIMTFWYFTPSVDFVKVHKSIDIVEYSLPYVPFNSPCGNSNFANQQYYGKKAFNVWGY